jgi:hypothetical protein
MSKQSLRPHPRLFVGPEEIARLRGPVGRSPALRRAERDVAALARDFARSADFDWERRTHNAHLIRARIAQERVLVLLTEYLRTGRRGFRKAIVEHVRAMGRWEYWSWIAWRRRDPRPEAIFDLSYGENSATLAVAFDLLHNELSAAERRLFLTIARDRALRPCWAHVGRPGRKAWWYGKPDTNWNTVCAGGAGLLCLATWEYLPEARRLLPRLEASVRKYMAHLRRTDGGWEEGLGYWNYGMRYALMYLLSAERATGRPHPMLAQVATRRSLRFPLDFCPHGTAAGFNDANGWAPMPVHLAAAERLGDRETAADLTRLLDRGPEAWSLWPNSAQLLLLHPRKRSAPPAPRREVVRRYRGLDWCFLADRLPDPGLYCSVRGGSSAVPHGQRDLMSFNVVVDGEALVANPVSGAYLDTTFSSRREELFDLTPAAKNALLINGVGVEPKSRVRTGIVGVGGLRGVRLDGTGAMGRTYRDRPAARFCGRLFLMLEGRALLVIDRVECEHAALVENRLYAQAAVKAGDAGALLRGRRRTARVAWAATEAAGLTLCRPALTWPVEPPALLRWTTKKLHEAVTLVTAISPGRERLALAVSERRGKIVVRVAGRGWRRRLELSTQLR